VAFTAEYAGGDVRADGREISHAGWFRAPSLPPVPGWGSIAGRLIDWFVRQAPRR
jgi:NAD+ diphosphatase